MCVGGRVGLSNSEKIKVECDCILAYVLLFTVLKDMLVFFLIPQHLLMNSITDDSYAYECVFPC